MAQTKIKLIADGVIDENHLKVGHTITTDNIGEGTNLYYTDARVGSYLSTNSYATEGYVTTAVANLVDAAPSTLDTLNELAAALGDDPNFATTVTNSIATKLPLAGGTLTGDLIVNTNVGIGTSSPDSIFTVARGGTSDWSAKFHRGNRTDQGIYTDGGGIALMGTDATNGITGVFMYGDNVDSNNYNHIRFYTYNSERLRIDSSGRVGIGTSSPSSILDLGAASNLSQRITISGGRANFGYDTAKGSVGAIVISGSSAKEIHVISGSSAKEIHFETTSNTPDMIINGAGNVGIGTTSPQSALDVNGVITARDEVIVSKAPSDTVGEGPNVYLSGNTGSSYTQLAQGVGRFTIWGWNGSTWGEKMTVRHSDGNVGIGTTNPYAKLTTTGLAIPNTSGGTPNEVGLPEYFETRSYYFNCTTSFATFLTHSSNNYTYLIVYRIGAADLTSVPNGMIMAFRNPGLGVSYIAGSSSYIQVSGYDLQIRSAYGSYGTVVQMQITRIG